MKNAVIFHGTSGTPQHFWFPFVKKELERIDYKVWVPQLPDADTPDIKKWLPTALDGWEYNEQTVLIAHSAGNPLILSLLENLETPVKLVILVAGFYKPLNKVDKSLILQESYNWQKIKRNAQKFVIINSDDDPWGCDDKMGLEMFERLGGDLILRHGEGHMGSDMYNQPYKEFPLLVKLVEAHA